jgi:hypothetical protein
MRRPSEGLSEDILHDLRYSPFGSEWRAIASTNAGTSSVLPVSAL